MNDINELDEHRWPNADWFDYTMLPEMISKKLARRERAIMVSDGSIFETAWYMRGFERMFTDFILQPDLATAILTRVREYYISFLSRVLNSAKGEVDLVLTADDLGGQQGLLMSRTMWEDFIMPHHMELNSLIRSFGAKVMYHTDGGVSEIVDGLVEMGIDILQALQFDAEGMHPEDLKRRFGGVLCFEGGVSVQHTLPHGTVTEVVEEVKHHIEILGEYGGYILGPSHAIQAGTPPENIAAMFETAAEYYPF